MSDQPNPFEARPGTILIAIDLGAESCRASLLRWIDGRPSIEIVHRFPNSPTEESGGLRWDIAKICAGVEEGLRRCADLAPEGITSIGVDGWAVDYVRLNAQGRPIANPFCYRDPRNLEAQTQVHARISPDRLYALTGIQILPINTLYQLVADSATGIKQNTPWTNLPEHVLNYLGGRRVSEYTNATHTQIGRRAVMKSGAMRCSPALAWTSTRRRHSSRREHRSEKFLVRWPRSRLSKTRS